MWQSLIKGMWRIFNISRSNKLQEKYKKNVCNWYATDTLNLRGDFNNAIKKVKNG